MFIYDSVHIWIIVMGEKYMAPSGLVKSKCGDWAKKIVIGVENN